MAKDSFIFYRDWYEAANCIGSEKLRLAFYETLATYALEGRKLEFPQEIAGYLFQPLKQIGRAEERYQVMCERNRENIKKRWSERKDIPSDTKNTTRKNGISENTTEYDLIPNDTTYTNNDNDNDNDNIAPSTPPMGEGGEGVIGVYEGFLNTQRSAMNFASLFPKGSDSEDIQKILRFTSDPSCLRRVIDLIKDHPKGQPLYRLLQSLEQLEAQDKIRPMSRASWKTACYINSKVTMNQREKLIRLIGSEADWQAVIEAVADCTKQGNTIKFPSRYIFSCLRQANG